MNTNILEVLSDIGEQCNENFHTLNNGGCCVYAWLVAEELTKRGYEVGGIPKSWMHSYGSDVDEARNNVSHPDDGEEWEENGIGFSHVLLGVKVGDKELVVDSENVSWYDPDYHNAERGFAKGRLTVEELKALASNKHNWNPTFSRKNIPALERVIKEGFANAGI